MALITCSKCGSNISDQAEKCPKCGALINGIVCKDCGNILPKNSKVCNSCGCPVQALPTTNAKNATHPQAVSVPPVVKQKNKISAGSVVGVIGLIALIIVFITVGFPFISKIAKDLSVKATEQSITQEQAISSTSTETVQNSIPPATTQVPVTQSPQTQAPVIQPPKTQVPTLTTTTKNLTFEKMKVGYELTRSFVVMSVLETSWSDVIKPTDTSSVYSYLSDQENESYFWISGNIKNTGGSGYGTENMAAEIIFDNKYKYNARLIADDGGNDFYNDYIEPMQSVKYYIYASVPDEVKNTYKTVTVKFGFRENFSGYLFDDFDECDYLYQVDLKK